MDTVRQRGVWLLLAGGVALSVALSRSIFQLGADLRPQVPSDSVLTLVLGDARLQLSQLLFDKVEEYFHGGVRCIACEQGPGHAGEGREPHEEGGAEAPVRGGGADPWSWLNARVHVQTHKHLENDTAVEMLPWVWAACRASPRNIQAFVAGSYVLARMVGRPEDAARLLEEGGRENPQCAELDFTLGELLLNRLNDPVRAEPAFVAALRKNAPADGPAGEEDRALRMKTLFYLGYLAKGRGDVEQLRAYVREADAVNPRHVSARDLHVLLKAAEKKE